MCPRIRSVLENIPCALEKEVCSVLGTMLGRWVKMVNKMGIVHVLMMPRVCRGVHQVRAVMGKNRMLEGTQVGSLPLSWSIRKDFLKR